MARSGVRLVVALGLGVTALALGSTPAVAQPGSPPPGVPVLRPPVPDKPPAGAGQKTLSINFDNKPWTDVVDWFGRESGLVWVGSIKVPGSFTVKAAPDQKFTIPEIVDLMNEQLLVKKFLLIRRGMSFTILPADEPIDPTLIPRIAVDELPGRGRTEIVQVVAPLKTLAIQETVPELEKMLSPFGAVTPLTGANHILLQDTAGNIARILTTLNIAESETVGTDSLNYECKYVRAAQAADTLRGLLVDKDTDVTGGPAADVENASSNDRDRDRDRDRRYYQPPPPPAKPNIVNVTVDNRTNSVLVTGSAVKIILAKKILGEIDVAKDGQMPIVVGPPELRTYPVPVGTAESVAKTLQEARQSTSPTLRVMPIPNSSQIMVYATPGEHMEILKELKGTEGVTVSDAATELIPLNLLDATETAATLGRIFPAGESGILIEAQVNGPVVGLLVKGSPAQIADVKEAIKALGESPAGFPGGGASGLRVIPVPKGNATVLAEGLAEMMQKMGKAPVRVVAPGGTPYEPEAGRTADAGPTPAVSARASAGPGRHVDEPARPAGHPAGLGPVGRPRSARPGPGTADHDHRGRGPAAHLRRDRTIADTAEPDGPAVHPGAEGRGPVRDHPSAEHQCGRGGQGH